MKATHGLIRPDTNRYLRQGDGTTLIEVLRSKPMTVVIDTCDEDLISQRTWAVFPCGSDEHWYASAAPGKTGRRLFMHRLLCEGPLVDHANGNTVDNRRANLRAATHTQNNANKRSLGGASKYKGVYRNDSLSRPWTVKIGVDNRRVTIGRFADEDEAALAYDRAALELWGEYACLNFPGPGQRGAVA